MQFKILPTISYRNFGYLPRSRILHDIYGFCFGNPNLVKRLQAYDIVQALDIRATEDVLDFGCGTGFFTVELAKVSRSAIGIDINPLVANLKVPSILQDRLHFNQADGRNLPFVDESFDKILASEIIAFIKDKDAFFREFRRVLKRNGRLVICNQAGHPVIENAFASNSTFLKLLRRIFNSRVPVSYDSYCGNINAYFGNESSSFLGKSEIEAIANRNGFDVESFTNTPRKAFGEYVSWLQFLGFIVLSRPLLRFGFIPHYAIFSILGVRGHQGYEGGLLFRLKKQS